tara:strand:+ start:144 stop:344 length:201 start_codon:yes stop_codon:yes gene_type:complete
VETLVAFSLYVFVGIGEDRRRVPETMRFRDVNECVYFAKILNQQSNRNLITAYCVPEAVNDKMKVY